MTKSIQSRIDPAVMAMVHLEQARSEAERLSPKYKSIVTDIINNLITQLEEINLTECRNYHHGNE